MKLEVGMYVRTRDGFLWKPKKIEIEEDNSVWFDDYYDYDVSDVKASHNIIDLIEEKDILDCEFGGIVLKCEVIKENNELGIGWDNDGDFINLESIDIKSIVTKEQFESMQYRIGE